MITIPQAELVEVSKLKLDGENPNVMSEKQLARLKTSIEKWGFIVPIITNRDLLVADGEQRLTVSKELGMERVPVIVLPIKDVDRRLLRQVLNKLRGNFDFLDDSLEFERIIQAGHEDDLKTLLGVMDRDIEENLLKVREPELTHTQVREKIYLRHGLNPPSSLPVAEMSGIIEPFVCDCGRIYSINWKEKNIEQKQT